MNNEEKNVGNVFPKEIKKDTEYKVYARRWLILAIFVMYSASNAYQWIQYAIIANIIVKYYDVTSSSVDWTSMIYFVAYVPLIFPACYFLDKKGLRWAAILGGFGTCAGIWIKALAVRPDLFWLSFLGQTIAAIAQIFVLSLPARLAAVWFGPDQVSSACSIGVFGNQLGVAVGFVLPPMVVKMHENIDDIGYELSLLNYSTAAFTTVVFLMILFFFKAEPPTPPSAAQAQANELANTDGASFIQSVKNLLTNSAYILLVVSYGINVAIYYAISTLLNQIILTYYPGSEEDAGRIGLVMVVAGMAGSVVCGIILDSTHKYKETTLGVYVCSLLAMVAYMFTLQKGIMVVYIVSGVLGFFMTGLLPVGFELAAEITYPEPEATSSGILNAASQLLGVAFTPLYSFLFNTYGDLWANGAMCAMLVIGVVLTALIRSEMHRQKAQSIEKTQGLDNPVMEKF